MRVAGDCDAFPEFMVELEAGMRVDDSHDVRAGMTRERDVGPRTRTVLGLSQMLMSQARHFNGGREGSVLYQQC